VDAAEVLAKLGGAASLVELDEYCGRAAVRRALRQDRIRRVARGRYALPQAPDPRLAAVRLCGVVSHESAAELWGIELLSRSLSPHVTVPVGRGSVTALGATVHRSPLAPAEVVDAVTGPLRTVLDLARSRPLAVGLAAADSALRQGLVLPADLRSGAERLRGPGSRRARTVARSADARAESVLESALRAILVQAGITGFDLQLQIDEGFRARVDLGDPKRRIVLEADSFAHHGHRSALARDCRRYNELTIRGWLVLRFAWEQVMFEPEWVAQCIRAAVASR
jgi:very-short-patch-repair endonuclease